MLLASCSSGIEPRNMAITNSAIYDYDESGLFHVILEIIDSKGSDSQSNTGIVTQSRTSVITSASDYTLSGAITAIADKLDKTLFGTHNRIRFLTERMASNELAMQEFVDFIIRNDEFDERPLLFIIKDEDIEKLFKADIGLHTLLGEYVYGTSRSNIESSSDGVFITTLKFIIDILEDGQDPVAGFVSVNNKDLNLSGAASDEYELAFEGMAVFNGIKYISYMSKDDAIVYNALAGKFKRARLSIYNDEISTAVEMYEMHSCINVEYANEQILLDVEIKAKLRTGEILKQSDRSISASNLKEQIEILAESKMKSMIQDTLTVSRDEIETDIFGIGNLLRVSAPNKWRMVAQNGKYINAMVINNIIVDFSVTYFGELINPFTGD
jgi:Ger(x)C family germination protein